MPFEIEYFNQRILAGIEAWPVDVLADYARLVELLAEHGPNLRLPHSRAVWRRIVRTAATRTFGDC